MQLIDNIKTRLFDDLKTNIKKNSKLAIAASSFSIYAFDALRKELEGIEELRFIFTSPSFLQENFKKDVPKFFIPHLFKEAELCGGEFELRLRNQLTQRAIAKECSKWVKEKVTFKSNKHPSYPIQTLMYVDNGNNDIHSWSNINGFTTADLGITPSKRISYFNSKIKLSKHSSLFRIFQSDLGR